MSSRARSRPRITLLAFQDIIMSVSGILIVLVLLLALEITDEPPPATSAPSVSPLQLSMTVNAARSERQQLEESLRRADLLAKEAARQSPAQIRDQIASLESEIERLFAENIELRAKAEQLRNEELKTKDNESRTKPIHDELAALEAAAANLKREIEDIRKDDRPVFTLPKGFKKDGWLAVIEKNRILIAPIGRRATPLLFEDQAGLLASESAADRFLAWTRKEASRESYFLLIVRPDGANDFEEITDSFRGRDVAFGYDVIGRYSPLIHPEKGAFQ